MFSLETQEPTQRSGGAGAPRGERSSAHSTAISLPESHIRASFDECHSSGTLRLSRAAELLLDDRSRLAIQASRETVQQFVEALLPTLGTVVQVGVSIRAYSQQARIEALCEECLPMLVQQYHPRQGDPIAFFALSLTDRAVTQSRTAEQAMIRHISALSKNGPELDELLIPELVEFECAAASDDPSPPDPQMELSAEGADEGGVSTTDSTPEPVTPLRSKEVIELEKELRLEEYNAETLRVLFDDMDPSDRLLAELYLLHGFEIPDLAVIIDRTEAETTKRYREISGSFRPRHRGPQLTQHGNNYRRDIERECLGLTESQGLSLLRALHKDYPNLRRGPEILDLVVDSFQFFVDLKATKDRELRSLRSVLVPPTGINFLSASSTVRDTVREYLHGRFPLAEVVRFDPVVASLFGPGPWKGVGTDFAIRDAKFLGACIRNNFYSSKISPESNLVLHISGPSGSRSIRNPLTREEAVEPEQAKLNSWTLLRKVFPHLDAITHGVPGFFAAKSILGLPSNASLQEVRAAFVAQGVLSGTIPDEYEPESANSAYFDPEVAPQEFQSNRDAMVRRRWSNIDDPEAAEGFIANVLGVPDIVKDLTHEAVRVLGPEIPTNHPFKYNPRLDSRYFDPEYVGPEMAVLNLQTALRDTFTDLQGFTYERVKECVGLPRMARLLGMSTQVFTEMRKIVAERGLLA